MVTERLRIKDLASEDRPREKILLKGLHTLTDTELLAVIIGSGNKEETALELSQRILESVDFKLDQLGKYSIKHLISQFKGIGLVKAVSIAAAMELGKRRKASELVYKERITASIDVYEVFHPILCDLHYEEFWVILLNRANKILEKVKISQGGISETVVDTRLIIREALSRAASGMILCHNHPSGNRKPSKNDDQITSIIKKGAEFFNLQVLDHIIVCDGTYYSYADEGRI